MPVGEVQDYTLYNDNGNKRRIFQNFLDAKAGDMIIGYESTPVKQVVAILKISAEQDGKSIYFEKVEGLSSPIDYATLKACPELEKMEYFGNPQGSLFKLTSGGALICHLKDIQSSPHHLLTAGSTAHRQQDSAKPMRIKVQRCATSENRSISLCRVT